MGQTECKPCSAADPTSDVVKVEPTLLGQQPDVKQVVSGDLSPTADAEGRRAEEARLQEASEAEAEESRRREEAEAAERLEAEARAAAEAAAVAAAAEQDEERARARRQREDAEQKVATFLRARGFKTLTSPKRSCLKTSFPLHVAVEENSAEMVTALLACGADCTVKNSAGKTPRALAEKLNKRGSHDVVVAALAPQ
mmetsp:Transcript_126022/g.364662  ORF Transcript_126022/g.364662 Transcript_126022/m.364662 type:complete len:198 (-) Transcript_126022:188-781(-)|eukprot:CAMPEP_0176070312 /NCGR_PEP_ID=MMETSP0120_2-20121206/35111_1 /TAXON_ID=160619 /ORGANISM="Kryptoperidinium foliaceum, Strain CCMP 1326" /LENGTH=197 /DNA_ID=CAMNT_0017403955 /DNA_START=28 /DNA_END=621 /DNA_ORIENTATION=+